MYRVFHDPVPHCSASCSTIIRTFKVRVTARPWRLCSTVSDITSVTQIFSWPSWDVDFDQTYNRLKSAKQGFINGWLGETDKPVVTDKNRLWLRMVETVKHLDPDFQMLVCIRDPKQIFGSIEAQHSRTRLLDYSDHMDPHTAMGRMEKLFEASGVVGSAMQAIEFMQDINDPDIHSRICYVAYESLIDHHEKVMSQIWEFLGLDPVEIDIKNLSVMPHESDSYYRFKYRHNTYTSLTPRTEHVIPARIATRLEESYAWFYRKFYSGKQEKPK